MQPGKDPPRTDAGGDTAPEAIVLAFGFFKKKDEQPDDAKGADRKAAGDGGDPNTETAGALNLQVSAINAAKFFKHAQAMHDASNYEYAMTLWLQGLAQDPTSTSGVENFAKSASAWADSGRRGKGPTKEQTSSIAAKGVLEKYLRALLEWGGTSFDWRAGLKAFDAAVKLKLNEPAYWVGSRVLALAGQDPKAKKDSFVEIMSLFAQIGGYDRAVVAGEIASRLDPADGKLAAEVKNMSAQATMSKGGYEDTGRQGGFRANVRDIQAQRAREEEERIVKTEDVATRAIEMALADYKSRPADIASIQKLARLLRERGTPEDEKLAFQVLSKGYEDTRNYRFKMEAGDIRLRVAKRKLREMRDATPDTAPQEKRDALAKAERQVMEMEVAEYEERVTNLPTDLMLRFELARRCLDAGMNEKAIEHFQAARTAPGVLTSVLAGLGTAFLRLGWLDEAESSYREAVAAHPNTGDETAAELRYGLMDVLQRKAVESRDVAQADEAFKLAASIAMARINFRDIRVRRQQLQDLVKSMREGKA